MVINSIGSVQGVISGGADRLSNVVDGMEFRTPAELQAFVRERSGQLRLRAGASFMVYVEKGGPSPYGSRQQAIEGFNKKTPFKATVVKAKAAGARMPGQWIKISADAKAKSGIKDQLKLVERQSVMCQPPTSKTLFAMTVTVL